jgi:hypothetical protein
MLSPVKLDDEGDAGSLDFRRELYHNFITQDVWGVISCCTAEDSTKLLKTLEPIDTPILIALDNTVERSALLKPSFLQLIPNNALQAQAILSKVGALLPEGEDQVNVGVYLWPSQNDFVRDLWNALQNKSSEAQNSRISLNPITVGKTLREIGAYLTNQDVVVYIGYHDGLERLLDSVNGAKIILTDACNENRVQTLMEERHRTYYLSQPSFDPSVYACHGYSSLSKIWLEWLRDTSSGTLDERLQSFVARVRAEMESRFIGAYRFVGATNQSGGYIIRKVQNEEAVKL